MQFNNFEKSIKQKEDKTEELTNKVNKMQRDFGISFNDLRDLFG